MLEESRGFYQTTKTFYQKERPGEIHCWVRKEGVPCAVHRFLYHETYCTLTITH